MFSCTLDHLRPHPPTQKLLLVLTLRISQGSGHAWLVSKGTDILIDVFIITDVSLLVNYMLILVFIYCCHSFVITVWKMSLCNSYTFETKCKCIYNRYILNWVFSLQIILVFFFRLSHKQWNNKSNFILTMNRTPTKYSVKFVIWWLMFQTKRLESIRLMYYSYNLTNCLIKGHSLFSHFYWHLTDIQEKQL